MPFGCQRAADYRLEMRIIRFEFLSSAPKPWGIAATSLMDGNASRRRGLSPQPSTQGAQTLHVYSASTSYNCGAFAHLSCKARRKRFCSLLEANALMFAH
jgi:hypothetical protein